MWRKDNVAFAVDNYKKKRSSDEDDDDDSSENSETDSMQSSSSALDDNNISETMSNTFAKSPYINKVTPSNKLTNNIEKNQVDGFNMFLNKMKDDNGKSNKATLDRQPEAFIIIDPSKKYVPPGVFTVTSINQAHDLMRVGNLEAAAADEQSSVEWLKTHSLDALRLTIEDLIAKGKFGNPKPDQETGEAMNCLVYDELTITDFEYRIHVAIEMYSKRIKWYLQGSKKLFGLIDGHRIGVLIDASDAHLGFGRLEAFQQGILHLIDEQIYKKESIYVGFVGTETKFVWGSGMQLNCRVLDELKQACMALGPMGGCNLLQALKQIVHERPLDTVVLIMGSCPDQDSTLLLDFFQQLMIGRNLPFHCVSYESPSEDVNHVLKGISDISQGVFHRYSSVTEELIYTSKDIDLILREIEKAQEVLGKIDLMRQGLFTNRISPVVRQIAADLKCLPQSEFLPKPPTFDDPLKFETPKFEPKSSKDWLRDVGLKSKKLGLYSVLHPNAYENKAEYIPSIGKMVTSSVYEKAMIQVDWLDGSKRNVHADLSQLFEYQKLLGEQVRLMEQRINWLATGSRRLLGTIIERKVVFLLDLSISNLKYLVHIQQSLKLLLQQQMKSKEKFNLIAFNSSIVPFRPHMVPSNEKNLQESWNWIKNLSCSGSRNFMGALRFVLENPTDTAHKEYPEGIYLFTSGVPDQNIEPLLGYIEEQLFGTSIKVHTVLFNVDDYDSTGVAIPSRYANITKTAEVLRKIAHSTNGRFHWFRESGIVESDDIRILMAEIDLAVEYSRRTQQIIKDFKEKYPDSHVKRLEKAKMLNNSDMFQRESSTDNSVALPPPRPTSLSKARKQFISKKSSDSIKIPKTLAYKVEIDPMKSVTNSKVIRPSTVSAFYTEDGNTKGVVYRNNSDTGSYASRKGIGKTEISDKEEWITSRNWMKKYSLKSMGLDLLRLVSGIDCQHEEALVKPIDKFIEAKYCVGLFPIVNVNGTRKHLQYTPIELSKYDNEAKKALLRYLRRLEWLIIGSKRIFGVIIEPAVTILLDTSGSMNPHMPELSLNLKTLIWEQLFKRKISFNLIAFNSQISKFREKVVTPDESNCHSAVGWVEHLVATGNTDTLNAIMISLEDPRVKGLYLLSDGKPDTSTEMLLRSVKEYMVNNNSFVPIHTISFNCGDQSANDFLKDLAKLTGGRFHKVCHDYDIRMFSQRVIEQCQIYDKNRNVNSLDSLNIDHNLLTIDPNYPPLPELDGDDLKRIGKEIQLVRLNLSKTNYFRELYYETKKFQEKKKEFDDAALSIRTVSKK